MASPAPAGPSSGTADSGFAPARSWWREHAPFLAVLAAGALVRLGVHAAFRPALVFSDGPTYLSFLDGLEALPARPAGYPLLVLRPLAGLESPLAAVAAAQHLLGLATAASIYLLVRRWGVGRWAGALATVPASLDAMLLLLEHAVLSDTLFQFLVTSAIVVLAWRRRPSVPLALAAGLLLGTAVTVRLVGQPLVLVGAAFCLLVGSGWWRRLATAAALVTGFATVVGGYAIWYHSERGVYALSEIHGKALYVRTASFVDCSRLSVPSYQRVLCPAEPVGRRRDATYYAWRDPRTVPQLRPPRGTTADEAMHEFARAAIRQQPGDYARVVLRDLALNFDVVRTDRFEHATAHKWRFDRYLDPPAVETFVAAYERHGGEQLTARSPYADALVAYQRVAYLPGPVLLACLLLGLLGCLGLGRARGSGRRAVCFLVSAAGAGLLAIPAVTVEFIWRYTSPGVVLLPAAGVLGYAALRGRPLPGDSESSPAPATRRTAAGVDRAASGRSAPPTSG